MKARRLLPIVLFLLASAALAVPLATRLQSGADRRLFVPGHTSAGHYQIEESCEACHEPWGGAKESACQGCHAAELVLAHDSHPARKFEDPRNADRRAQLDATRCLVCHREHVPAQTRAMAVTQPDDYCQLCHEDIAQHRPTHAGLGFDTCAAAGCHNFHDNRSLYQDLLVSAREEPDLLPEPRRPTRMVTAPDPEAGVPRPDAPAAALDDTAIKQWQGSAHARAGVNCLSCHQQEPDGAFVARVPRAKCATCHAGEDEGFLAGKHGMRLAANLSPMTPLLARLPMRREAHDRQLGCTSCHDDHAFDVVRAASDACQSCHADEHTRAYAGSPHARLWQHEREGAAAPGTGVSCATCHMPRLTVRKDGADIIEVDHNQNANLRPNEKMARAVCGNCHGLPFTLMALADAALVERNFTGTSTAKVASFDMALAQITASKKSKNRTKKGTSP